MARILDSPLSVACDSCGFCCAELSPSHFYPYKRLIRGGSTPHPTGTEARRGGTVALPVHLSLGSFGSYGAQYLPPRGMDAAGRQFINGTILGDLENGGTGSDT